MSESRTRMVTALNEVVIPKLKTMGFSGRFPHFRRPKETTIDLLTFQFSRRSGGFVVEIASCSADGLMTSSRRGSCALAAGGALLGIPKVKPSPCRAGCFQSIRAPREASETEIAVSGLTTVGRSATNQACFIASSARLIAQIHDFFSSHTFTICVSPT